MATEAAAAAHRLRARRLELRPVPGLREVSVCASPAEARLAALSQTDARLPIPVELIRSFTLQSARSKSSRLSLAACPEQHISV